MILHLSHIFLTEGRTFIFLPFGMPYITVISHGQPLPMIFDTYCFRATSISTTFALKRWREEYLRTQALLEAIRDAPTIQVVHGKFNRDLVSGQDLDVMHAHLAGYVSQNLVTVLEFYLEHRIRQGLADRAFEFNYILLRQKCSFMQTDSKQQS